MLTIIRCKDCGETMAYDCSKPPWKCAKCGKSHPHVLSSPKLLPKSALKVKPKLDMVAWNKEVKWAHPTGGVVGQGEGKKPCVK